jgi:arylsulfatase A-like enzyme
VNRKNIVLLTIECLRKAEFQVPASVSNLHRIAKTSLAYPNFYSSSSWTPPSIFSLFTSKYPFSNEGRVSIGKRDLTVAQLLRESGYYTVGLNSIGWLSKFFGFDKGFEDFFDTTTGGSSRATALWRIRRLGIRLIRNRSVAGDALKYLYNLKCHYRPPRSFSERLNTRALRWLDDHRGDRPFFLWIHYPETHEPYLLSKNAGDYTFGEIWRVNMRAMKYLQTRKEKYSRFTDAERYMLLDLYRGELRQVDRSVAGLLDGLDNAGYLDDSTYVFILGDHGQQFFEHGNFGHGIYLYQELCNIPLLIYNRGLQGKEDGRLASGLDIAPTILELAGIACPPQFCGQSILNSTDTNRDIILQEGRDEIRDFIIDGNNVYLDLRKYRVAIVRGKYKFIMDSHAKYELYDLERDSHEQNNLASTEVQVCDDLRVQLERHLRDVQNRDFAERTRNRIHDLKSEGRI